MHHGGMGLEPIINRYVLLSLFFSLQGRCICMGHYFIYLGALPVTTHRLDFSIAHVHAGFRCCIIIAVASVPIQIYIWRTVTSHACFIYIYIYRLCSLMKVATYTSSHVPVHVANFSWLLWLGYIRFQAYITGNCRLMCVLYERL